MAEATVDNLKIYWDHFFKAETGAYEKSTWMDLFLAEFLIRLNNGANPKDLIKFCPVSGVVSLVGCELLCGIHRVTSSINTHYSAPMPCLDTPCSAKETATDNGDEGTEPKPEETRLQSTSLFTRSNAQSSADILRKYLLGGVVWKCLVLLKVLGVEGLSCCRQLSSVLIWLFGELGGGGGPPTPHLPATRARTPIHQLFSSKIWSNQKLSNQGVKSNVVSTEKSSASGRTRFTPNRPESETKKRKQSRHSDQSSDSGDNGDLQILNRSLTIKVCAPNDDFDYFDSPVKSTNEYPNESLYNDPYYAPKKIKPKTEDYMNDQHREIINSEITTFELTLLIIDLLQELCKAESSLTGTEGSQISVQCINFSLRNLCSLQFGSLPLETHYDSEEISRIKVALTELLIASLDKVLIHADLCAKLINNGILPMLLRILEDVICKTSNKYKSKEDSLKDIGRSSKTESENLLKFVFGISYSITAFFHCLLIQCRSVDKLREFTDQFKLYGECLKGGLLKECIELMIRIPGNQEDVVVLIKKLIESIGKLISGMKRVRSEVVHSAACPRSKHKACRQRVAAGMHHHHDIMGEAGTGLPLSSACCISVLYGTLTSLLTDEEIAKQSVLRNKILRVMLNSGVCCCFSPGFLMESIVRLMLTHNGVAILCLQLLEHTVYGELGASVLTAKVTDQLPCSVCEPCDDKRDLIRKYCPHGVSSIERKSVWSFLIHYNSLLQLDNHNNVLHATVGHLLRVTPKCRMEMKYELLFSVIYPTFIVAKHRYMIRLEESAYFLTVSCLNIFASLLNTVSFAEQFIQKGGLSYVLELVSLCEFSNQCCSILEIAIIVEIFKLMKENSDSAYYREMSSLSSVQMLIKSLSEMTDKCYKIYRMKLPVEKFDELCDVTKERESLSFTSSNQMQRKISMPQSIIQKTTYAISENVTEDTIEDYIEALKNIHTFWKSCAGLCLYSPMFREFIVSESVFIDSYSLLKVLLHYLCNFECGMAEMRLLIKLVEALLTVQFAVSDVTSGRSKETSCTIVRASLSAPMKGGVPPVLEGGGGLRAMCEALIRVAVAEPSPNHVMPRLTHTKTPPLGCPSGNSSPDCSSSEDSNVGPYASEHSEPYTSRQDEGYEADVEIGKLDLLSTYKSRKTYGSLSAANVTGYQLPAIEAMSMECAEYTKNGDLAHPELCIIVVDILTQLIHKLLTSPQSAGEHPNIQRVGAGLARACCARLSGALARARAAPPLLLHRLLAPHAARLLTHRDDQLQDLQRSILELIHVLASQSIEPAELSAFLKLFVADDPPLSMLLAALQRLVTSATPNTPDCILTFPVDRGRKDDVQTLLEEQKYVIVNSTTSQSHQAENFAKKLHEAHLRSSIPSSWSCHAVRVGVEGAGWAPWLQGFAVSMWLHAAARGRGDDDDGDTTDDWQSETQDNESKKSPIKKESQIKPIELSHVFSVGHDSLIFEVWLDTATGYFTFRLSRPEASSNKILSETRVESGMPPRQWSCIALNVREVVHKRRIHIQVTMFVNGCECETVSLPLQGILVRKVTPTNVLIGHATTGGDTTRGVYHVSHVHVYRAPVLAPCQALHLAAHGPDNYCQVKCECPNFPLVLSTRVLDASVDWDHVFEMSGVALRELHDNLLLTFAASAPGIINLYHQTVALPTVFAGRVPSTASLMASPGMPATGGPGSSIPETLFTTWTGSPLPSRHRGLPPALYMLGGPDVMLYLFARVVELEGTAEEQAMGLSILLRVCRADNRLYAMLYGDDTLDMLHTVFTSNKCTVSHHFLKVIFEEACSIPILTQSGGNLVVTARSDCVLLEPRLLVLLTRAWRQLDTDQELTWEVESSNGSRQSYRGSLWALTLCCIRVVVRDEDGDHPFNHYQMTRVGLMRHLLLACKERFLNSESGPLGTSASSSLVELIRGLMGAPPLLDRLVLLCDFLLLMHQASDTFVTHSRANFYFLLTSDTPESHSLTAALKKRSSRRTKKKNDDVSDMASSSSVTSEDVLDFNEKKETEGLEGSVESTKQMKGLINSQIKEGRKHNVSSTSENSDITTDKSGATLLDERHARFVETQSFKSGYQGDAVANMARVLRPDTGDIVNNSTSGQELEASGKNSKADGKDLDPGDIHINAKLSEVVDKDVEDIDNLEKCIKYEGLGAIDLKIDAFNLEAGACETDARNANNGASGECVNRDGEMANIAGKITSKSGDVADKGGDLTSNSGEVASKGGDMEMGEGTKERLVEDLTGYIVIDIDDVKHTTVEMYSSGIYQQRKVRAGAEPGWTACEGLLLLLRDTISVLPDQALAQAVCGAIQAECLVVLGNHRNASVRAALVRVVAALQRRAPQDLSKKLRQQNYYLHLANQVSLYPASWELASACAALLTKCDVPLEDQLDDDIWMDLMEDSMYRCPPLLAILPCCLDDVPLAHNITLVIRRIIDKATLKMLTEVSVLEVVVRTIRAIGLMDSSFEGRELLLEDLHELLNRLAVKALYSQHNMQTISEIHQMLTYLEISSEGEDNGPSVARLARDAQLSLFTAQLDHLEERLHSSYSAHTKYANYFTTVLSSAVSLGSDSASRTERTELASRHLATVVRAVTFLVTMSPRQSCVAECALVDRLLATLLPAVSGVTPQRPKWWVSSGADWLSPLQDLFWWAACPAPGVRVLQPRLLRALYLAPAATVHLLTPPDPPATRKLAVYLLMILKNIHAEAENGIPPVELAITDWARGWAVATQAGLAERLPSDTLVVEAERLLEADEQKWAKTTARQRANLGKVVFSKDALANKLTETAMGITRQVVDIQNGERKAFMEHLRRAQSEAVASTQRWQRLIDSYTHEQAVWHEPRSYPQSWQLDATEGPGRVRVRLRRAHLDIHPRFLKQQYKYKAETIHRPSPLRSVVGGNSGLRGGLVARLQLNETVSYMARVTYVTVASETVGELLLSDRCIHFVPEDSEDPPKLDRHPEQSGAQSWPLEAVVRVSTRRWCLQERAAELFLSSGHAHLVAFADVGERNAFLKALQPCQLPGRIEPDTLIEAMTQWRNGAITNWEYLMRLNGLGGRSYNDLMQYPVLPFIIADYSSRILDLNDPGSFRDLSKPMAIQNKNREQHYINTYNDMKASRREGCSPLLSSQPHHYSSLYSNSGGVLHYLVRLPPFTELFLNYQDNNFDMPDRTFHSLATTWRLITNDSPTDVKELIPELFYLPELFHNNEGLNLGMRQCGAPVDNVELPPWAADARLFTLIHRQALEAPHVTEKLPLWIDLVFGYKQTGQPAIDAINVFPACTYYGFDPSALEDELDRTAAAAMVRSYGQAPRQLLKHPHPHQTPELVPSPQNQMSVWSGVEGARWGRYCGSPALPPPAPAARRTCPGVAHLQALPHTRSVAVAVRATALVAINGDAMSSTSQSVNQQGSIALLSWGHADNIMRLKRRRDARPELLLPVPALDQITKVSSTCVLTGCPTPVFIGHSSGRVLALRFPAHAHSSASSVRTRALHAHSAAITDIHVCGRAGLLATASVDGRIVLWDLNKLLYIRTLPNRDMLPVTHVTISETLCDVATVHDVTQRQADVTRHDVDVNAEGSVSVDMSNDSDSYEKDASYKYKSLIRVHTVNASFVGSVKVSESVTCICYSNAPEGISVNVIAAGLSNGGVRLYSSWDLRRVAYIMPVDRSVPLLSLTYSSDSSLLFACYSDGQCVAWESGGQGKPAPVRILPAHALF